MDKNAKILVTGHRGMVGSALVRRLQAGGYANLLTRTHTELDLIDQRAVHAFLAAERPGDIRIAWDALQKRGPGWRRRMAVGMTALGRIDAGTRTAVNVLLERSA